MARTLAAAPPGGTLDRIVAFRATYLAIFVSLLLYTLTIAALESALTRRFGRLAEEAIAVRSVDAPVPHQIVGRLEQSIAGSRWVRLGGARVQIHVVGRNGQLLYLNGVPVAASSPALDPAAIRRQAELLLPAAAVVEDVSIPIDSVLSSAILIFYGALLVQALYVYNRRQAARQAAALAGAHAERDAAAQRADAIGGELQDVRKQLRELLPADRARQDEIRSLQSERETLRSKLAALATREEELRSSAERALELDEERCALEALLDEASNDLQTRDAAIAELEESLKKAAKSPRNGGSARARELELWTRRMRTLYKTVEIDDRALADLVALREEALKLKAEEAIKRLADEAENVAVRRKVGGLPASLSIFELGFAGKGRIYYARGRQRRFRILTLGTKASQKTDIEYLSRISPSDLT